MSSIRYTSIGTGIAFRGVCCLHTRVLVWEVAVRRCFHLERKVSVNDAGVGTMLITTHQVTFFGYLVFSRQSPTVQFISARRVGGVARVE